MINTMTKLFALAALAVSSATASDVYATFSGQNGDIAPNFDISNTGCFAAEGATMVSFSQAGGSTFNGPYCLSAWKDGACPGDATAKQGFSSLHSGTKYMLNDDMSFTGSYKWSPEGC